MNGLTADYNVEAGLGGNTDAIRNSIKRFLNDEGKPKTEWFVNDQLHLNKLGYAEWSNIIKDAINREIPLF